MPRGIKGKATKCKCGSEDRVEFAACIDCRRAYGRTKYREKVAAAAPKQKAKGGAPPPPPAPPPRQPAKPGHLGRRIPPADAPMHEKLLCPEWLNHYKAEGLLDWAQREAAQ